MMDIFTNNKAFSITELLVTLSIMAIVAGIAIPIYNSYQSNANSQALKSDVGAGATAYRTYSIANNDYCASLADVGLNDVTSQSLYQEHVAYYFGSDSASPCTSSGTYSLSGTTLPHTKCKNDTNTLTLGAGNTYSGQQKGYFIEVHESLGPKQSADKQGSCVAKNDKVTCGNTSATTETACQTKAVDILLCKWVPSNGKIHDICQ